MHTLRTLFHTNAKFLPESEQKLIVIPTGKRTRDGEPVYTYGENNCFNAWHRKGREAAWGGVHKRVLPEVNLNQFTGTSQISSSLTIGADNPDSPSESVTGGSGNDPTAISDREASSGDSDTDQTGGGGESPMSQ